MQIFDAEATRAALPFDRLVPALRDIFAEGAEVPRRHVHELAVPGAQAVTSLLMPAWQPGKYCGVKIVTVFPSNGAAGLPSVMGSYFLMSARSGQPLAVIDGRMLTLKRTAAASALAAKYLSRPDSDKLLMVGTGALAPHLIVAHASVRPIRELVVWGRDPKNLGFTGFLAHEFMPRRDPATSLAEAVAICTV